MKRQQKWNLNKKHFVQLDGVKRFLNTISCYWFSRLYLEDDWFEMYDHNKIITVGTDGIITVEG